MCHLILLSFCGASTHTPQRELTCQALPGTALDILVKAGRAALSVLVGLAVPVGLVVPVETALGRLLGALLGV